MKFRILPAALSFLVVVKPAVALEAVLEAERKELAGDCQTIAFDDSFAVDANINGDGVGDVLTDYGSLVCDGSRTMFCGSGGCTQRLYLGRADGSLRLVASFLAYGIEFDRPDEASFVVSSHGGDCGQAGAMGCQRRFRLDGEKLVLVGEVGGSGTPDIADDSWRYDADGAMAAIGSGEDQLQLACDGGGVRVRYSAHWMFENGEINDHIREWDAGTGVVASFDLGARETDVPMRLDEEQRLLVARATIGTDAPLLDEIARGRRLTIHHGGSLEHELGYALAGSGAAIRALRRYCR
jgi:hypothetical protein